MRNIFLEKSYIKCGGETILRSFSKKSKLSISLDQQSEILNSFLFCVQIKVHKNILKSRCITLSLILCNAFSKKRGLELASLPHFLFDFWRKTFLFFHLLVTHQISLSGCLYFMRYWAIWLLRLFVNQVVTWQILKLALSFITLLFLHDQNVKTKNLHILRTKRAFWDEIKTIFHDF